MKKAVIVTGGKQYLVAVGDEIDVELLGENIKNVDFKPYLIIDGDKTTVGKPEINTSTVSTTIVNADQQTDKVVAIRYKSKKRVHKLRGHRQHVARIKVDSIS